MRKQILFIYNPSAGKNGANEILSQAIGQLTSDNCRVTVYPVMKGYGAEKILKEEKGKFDRVLCCGGDGTLNHTINGLLETGVDKPLLGYIPTGSTNDFAASMGIKNLTETCRTVAYGQPFFYDIGKFNDSYFNYIAAFGAFTDVSYVTPQNLKNQLGHAAYIIEGIRHLPLGKYYTLTAKSDESIYSGDYIYGSVSNSTSIGGMSIPVRNDIKMNDGLFEVILIKAPKTVMETQNLLTALITQNFDSPFIEYFKTDKIEFSFDKETPWTLDGEFGGNVTDVNINVINKAIGLLK